MQINRSVQLLLVFALFFVMVQVVIGIAHLQREHQRGIWVNCGLTEISPDYTNDMREACRQARKAYASRTNK